MRACCGRQTVRVAGWGATQSAHVRIQSLPERPRGAAAIAAQLRAGLEAPTRADVDALPGLTVLEFGTTWCGHCRAAQPAIAEALAQPTPWRHIRVEDGPGQALGRSFHVKLWPTLVLLKDGQEVARVVRPRHRADITDAMYGA